MDARERCEPGLRRRVEPPTGGRPRRSSLQRAGDFYCKPNVFVRNTAI
jgi:hypothetical protein